MHARYPPKSMSSCEYRILPLLLLLPPAIPALNMMISRSSKRASPTPPPAGNSARNPPPNARKSLKPIVLSPQFLQQLMTSKYPASQLGRLTYPTPSDMTQNGKANSQPYFASWVAQDLVVRLPCWADGMSIAASISISWGPGVGT
ncbi:hypothetical protein HDK90DRAFT_7318 [Phyllosticta capitalensis]|uniref:Uncharacterized protein n=1 Tax=Phyllosticta capitalensis TaxID=121624 RepID=A0ABR1Z1M8_9PEZI